MFYLSRPHLKIVRIRNEWGEIETHIINTKKLKPSDKELQEQLQSTAIQRTEE